MVERENLESIFKLSRGGIDLSLVIHPSLVVMSTPNSCKLSPVPELSSARFIVYEIPKDDSPENFVMHAKQADIAQFISCVYASSVSPWVPNGELHIETTTRAQMDNLLAQYSLEEIKSIRECLLEDPNHCGIVVRITKQTGFDSVVLGCILQRTSGVVIVEPDFLTQITH